MLTTPNLMVISSYNCDPKPLIPAHGNYLIYDQSDIEPYMSLNSKLENVIIRENSGHSLGNVLEFIVDNYANLPNSIAFVKANVVPRHTTSEHLRASLEYTALTPIYHDPNLVSKPGISGLIAPGFFWEINNSWYVEFRNHEFFCNFNKFLEFLFVDFRNPEVIVFAPGGCMIVERDRITKYPKSFYETLHYLVTYRFFPSEAFMVERLLITLFLANYQIHPRLNDFENCRDILIRTKISQHECASGPRSIFSRIKSILK